MTHTTPNPGFERTARKQRLRVPSALRASAAAQRERWASCAGTSMRSLVLTAAIALSLSAQAQGFDRALLSGLWVESTDTKPACESDNLHVRYELSADGRVLVFKLDRPFRINPGRTVDQYSATVVRSTPRSLVIRYNSDVGDPPANYPKEWEMAFVAPGVYRWRATEWPKGRVNSVVGIRCSS